MEGTIYVIVLQREGVKCTQVRAARAARSLFVVIEPMIILFCLVASPQSLTSPFAFCVGVCACKQVQISQLLNYGLLYFSEVIAVNQDKLGKMGRRVQVRERVIFSGNKIARGQASGIRSTFYGVNLA